MDASAVFNLALGTIAVVLLYLWQKSIAERQDNLYNWAQEMRKYVDGLQQRIKKLEESHAELVDDFKELEEDLSDLEETVDTIEYEEREDAIELIDALTEVLQSHADKLYKYNAEQEDA